MKFSRQTPAAADDGGQHRRSGSLVAIKRGDDQWFQDGRIPLEMQLQDVTTATPTSTAATWCAGEDPNWDPGAPGRRRELRAQRANEDTFHYTNAAPQHSRLNQGAELWLGLENHVLESARTHGFKACVFTGPVIRDDDPRLEPGRARAAGVLEARRHGGRATGERRCTLRPTC